MSDGLLKNLDWSNLIIAGGIVLGTLLSVDSPDGQLRTDSRWASSDIDIYAYGLTPREANEKIKHLFDTFRANLSPGTPTLVVRNCTIIKFYARYPLRRIQIVKLVESPKSVLLNFDLDVCAMGWDGATLWMLPRAARALETGCSAFTMSLIHGHYLSDRCASTQERIFKYVDKGYGIRILPSYLSNLVARKSAQGYSSGEALLSSIADGEREWTAEQVEERGDAGLLECVVPRCAGYRASRCLKGFGIFMRCVALWEMDQRDEVVIREDNWASTWYQDAMMAYDDMPGPRYKWDKHFDIAAFQRRITKLNEDELRSWADTDHHGRLARHGVGLDGRILGIQRTVCAPTLDVLLADSEDWIVRMQVLLPLEFASYANGMIAEAQERAGLREEPLLVSATEVQMDEEGLFLWRVGTELMWQQLDRSVDEVFELLYAFRRVNEHLRDPPVFQARRLRNELARRQAAYNEFNALAVWVGLEKKTKKKKST